MDDLPEEYSYKIIENNERRFIFRIKDISDKEAALAWLSAYEEKSKFTWRKARTFPNVGKIYVFHGDYRCHHNTDKRSRGLNKRISKHTGCEATLQIKVKRYLKKSRSQIPDVDVKEYPCIVTLDNKHNHSQFSAEVLRFRDIAEETKDKLLHYFQQGLSATLAQHALEVELWYTEDDFESAKLDASLLPSISVIQHLFNRFSAAGITSNVNSTRLKTKRKNSGIKGVEIERTSQLHQDNKISLLNELNHDVIFKIGDKEIHAHRDVLRAQSRVLEAMLSHNIMKENRVIIEVYDCDPQAMQQFLLYMYTGEVATLDQTSMLNLLYIADKYDVELFKEKCCNLIKNSLSPTNICEVIQYALNHSNSRLLDSATEYFGNNALDVLLSTEWQSFLKVNSEAANELLIKYFENSKTLNFQFES